MDTEDLAATAQMLHKNWGLPQPSGLGWEDLRAALFVQLRAMLSDDFERLVQAMYRLDVAEAKFTAALSLPNLDERAAALANIVLARELQRVETWRKYSQG